MVEYLLMVALIAIALVAAVMLFQGALTDNVEDTANCLDSLKNRANECPGAGG